MPTPNTPTPTGRVVCFTCGKTRKPFGIGGGGTHCKPCTKAHNRKFHVKGAK